MLRYMNLRLFHLFLLALWLPAMAAAEVFFAKDEALKLAFPDADRVDTRTFVLNEEEKRAVERLSKTQVESSIFTFYIGYKGSELLGYAAIETHMVRTMPETFMVVLSPAGDQRKTVILAFYEPPEYIASQKWLDQFTGRPLSDDLWPGRDIHGIVGSTLTTNAITGGVRKVLALYRVLIAKEQ